MPLLYFRKRISGDITSGPWNSQVISMSGYTIDPYILNTSIIYAKDSVMAGYVSGSNASDPQLGLALTSNVISMQRYA